MNTRAVFSIILLLGLLTQTGYTADPPQISVHHLKDILREQGFSGSLKGYVRFTNLGVFGCGTQKYRIFYFVWAETRPDGNPGHGQQRIVLIDDQEKYVGSYLIDDPPVKVTRDAIIFSYDEKDGNEIRCVDNSLPNGMYTLEK
jgi:hypothetical protein